MKKGSLATAHAQSQPCTLLIPISKTITPIPASPKTRSAPAAHSAGTNDVAAGKARRSLNRASRAGDQPSRMRLRAARGTLHEGGAGYV